MRTYSRRDFEAARDAWDKDFDQDDWGPFRAAAAERGMLYPPAGSKFDSWEDPKPSQRAILYRAIVDTPETLMDAINSSRSWSEVVGKVMLDLHDRREYVRMAEEDRAWERQQYRGPMEAIGTIIGRVRDSLP